MNLAMNATGRGLHRLHCALLVASGHSPAEVAAWFDVEPRTIQRWMRAAGRCGIEVHMDRCHCGRPRLLAVEQVQLAQKFLEAPPCILGYPDKRWTGKRVAMHLEKVCGIQLSARTCQRMIVSSRSVNSSAEPGVLPK